MSDCWGVIMHPPFRYMMQQSDQIDNGFLSPHNTCFRSVQDQAADNPSSPSNLQPISESNRRQGILGGEVVVRNSTTRIPIQIPKSTR